ncbi:hypothetical protein KIN20_037750 [Parelaphostrongylus tenuis]|uniref:Uncharacterized protein n=1 Tax=Parelaphostrongylus tenuis TaxID=148309 RepID=A0AAD5WLF4_PARTN|nr:hypothetical protein KIN20_037750 [Parelaphostrongylus tenuis]
MRSQLNERPGSVVSRRKQVNREKISWTTVSKQPFTQKHLFNNQQLIKSTSNSNSIPDNHYRSTVYPYCLKNRTFYNQQLAHSRKSIIIT